MPLSAFFELSRNIDRLAAEQDLRALRVAVSAGNQESMEATREDLNKQLRLDDVSGPVAEKLDRVGLAELRLMTKAHG